MGMAAAEADPSDPAQVNVLGTEFPLAIVTTNVTEVAPEKDPDTDALRSTSVNWQVTVPAEVTWLTSQLNWDTSGLPTLANKLVSAFEEKESNRMM